MPVYIPHEAGLIPGCGCSERVCIFLVGSFRDSPFSSLHKDALSSTSASSSSTSSTFSNVYNIKKVNENHVDIMYMLV